MILPAVHIPSLLLGLGACLAFVLWAKYRPTFRQTANGFYFFRNSRQGRKRVKLW